MILFLTILGTNNVKRSHHGHGTPNVNYRCKTLTTCSKELTAAPTE
jgi:hypothetical protein